MDKSIPDKWKQYENRDRDLDIRYTTVKVQKCYM